MEGRRQTDENLSCSVGSGKWLGERGAWGDREKEGEMWVKERRWAEETRWREGWREGVRKKAVAEKQEFIGSAA